MSDKNVKKRNWAFIVYPESAPEDWLQILSDTGLQCAISPLHDRDVNPTGELKKPHYHVIACYSGPTSYNVVKGITDSLEAPRPQALEQVKGYYRYLTHKDNPEKAQYSENDIRFLNGFNILDYTELSKREVAEIKKALQQLIIDNDILEYSDFMDCLLQAGMGLEYDIASSSTFFFDRYISSRRNKRFKTDG